MGDNPKFFSYTKLLLLLVLIYIAIGCVPSNRPDQTTGEFAWPPPPEAPRIKWLKQWYHKYDFGKPSQVLTLLMGEEKSIRLRRPNGVVADSFGNVYVADSEHHAIFVFDLQKNVLRFIGDGTVGVPIGLAIDNKRGVIFVSDSQLDKVFALDKQSGRVLMILGDFKNPSGLAYDEDRERLYISDTKNHVVKAYDKDGKPLFTIGKKGSEDGEFSYPSYLAVDRKGWLYVVDSFNFRVQIFDVNGKFVKKFGKLGDASGAFSRPAGIGVDSDGHIYVADTAFNNFQIFDFEGKLLLWIGQGGKSPGEFSLPSGMYIDKEDRIYISDTFNRRVQVFQYLKEKK